MFLNFDHFLIESVRPEVKMLKGNKKSDGNKMKRDEVVSTTNLFSKLAGHVFKKHVNYTNLIQLNLTFKNVKS
jgi:hypothetical protein